MRFLLRATMAIVAVGWLAFIVLVSYFFLAESGGLRSRIIQFEIPGYAEDMQRLGKELGEIRDSEMWRAGAAVRALRPAEKARVVSKATKGVAGRSKISCGEPICSTGPWFMTTTRSATSSA